MQLRALLIGSCTHLVLAEVPASSDKQAKSQKQHDREVQVDKVEWSLLPLASTGGSVRECSVGGRVQCEGESVVWEDMHL